MLKVSADCEDSISLHASERDDRAPLRNRTRLQCFRRCGARHNSEEMRAVSGRLGGGRRSIWDFLARGCFALKTQIKRVGFPWISLDSLVRIETYQCVTRDFRSKVFSCRFCPLALEAPEGKAAEEAMRKRRRVHRTEHNANSDFLQSIVAPTRRKLNRPGGFGHNGDEQQEASERAAHETNHRFTVPLPTNPSDYCWGLRCNSFVRGLTNSATDH